MKTFDLDYLLQGLPENALVERRYAKGVTVFQQGAPCGGIWIVQQGRVDLQRVTSAGHLVLIHRAFGNESFAEASLFTETYHCSAVAVDHSNLLEINRAALLGALHGNPAFAVQLCSMLARQVQVQRRLAEILSVRKAQERVYQAATHGLLGDDIKAFSARIGLTHEAVYRALARLTEQGRLVKASRGRYRLPDPAENLAGI